MKDLLVITGGSAGIGLATAVKFLGAGYDVVSISRRTCPSPDVISIQADLAAAGFIDLVRRRLSSTSHLQRRRIVLVHNAAQSWHDSAGDVTAESLRSMMETSVIAPAALNQLLLPFMSQGSAIIYIGSTLSTRGAAGSFSYVAAKHAVVGMMRATCQDLFGKGIHSVCVCPGATDTEMLRSLFDPGSLAKMGEMSSVQRLIEPEEIAAVIYQAAGTPVLNGALVEANYGSASVIAVVTDKATPIVP